MRHTGWSASTVRLGALTVIMAALTVAAPVASARETREFLGLSTYTEVWGPLAGQLSRMTTLVERNPHLRGLTVRPTWRDLEPEDGRFHWDSLDRMVALTRSRSLHLTLEIVATVFTPDWVYQRGARAFETREQNPFSREFGKSTRFPMPWDETYRKYWRRLVSAVAERYGSEPGLLSVTVHGHNQKLEMYMPRRPEDMQRWRQLGWSVESVEQDWKAWIDFYAGAFPRAKIGLMLSSMYDASTDPVVERLASYAVQKYPDRALLMTAILAGRNDQKEALQIRAILNHPQDLNAQETVSSFNLDPKRQGSLELFVYNMRQLSPLFVRLWLRDAADPGLCARLLAEYERARGMSLADYRKELEAKGLYTTIDTYRPPQRPMGR